MIRDTYTDPCQLNVPTQPNGFELTDDDNLESDNKYLPNDLGLEFTCTLPKPRYIKG